MVRHGESPFPSSVLRFAGETLKRNLFSVLVFFFCLGYTTLHTFEGFGTLVRSLSYNFDDVLNTAFQQLCTFHSLCLTQGEKKIEMCESSLEKENY